MAQTIAEDFAKVGACLFRGVLSQCITELEAALADVPADEAGARLHGIEALERLLDKGGCIATVAATVLGPSAKPVRAILLNKTPARNWSLGWHQDRTICVKEKRDVEGFGPWTIKGGMHHVAPPFDLLAKMVTVRAHLDDVPATNAPLMFAPGSHALGRVAVGEIEEAVRQCGTQSCLAKAGDVWLYATPILHASDAASMPTARRVLQVDYAANDLPAGLEWLGI